VSLCCEAVSMETHRLQVSMKQTRKKREGDMVRKDVGRKDGQECGKTRKQFGTEKQNGAAKVSSLGRKADCPGASAC